MRLTAIVLLGTLTVFGLVRQSDEEKEFQAWMKTTFTASSSLRKNIEAKSGEAAATDAARLEAVFKKVGDFWSKRKVDDAVKWSRQAETASSEAGSAARAGDFDKASASLRTLNATCTACHSAHRERLPEGGYKIR